ncbi:MAG: hypothetical protein CMK37_04600 [Porticoccaceae bacterium]|jgi:hypothetical protein|nr:hypothetical protein [Porticoccaceae bacterium]|tara:strand:- start:3694 stop:4143 length:450 start_codon:yes stop_codon:yes gene_type:complete
MAKKFVIFISIVILVMTLFVIQTTASYIQYLYQMGMPVDFSVFLSAVWSDLIGMNLHGVLPPIALVISVVLGVAFLVAHLILKRIPVEKKYFYAFAGASGMFTLVTLFPALSYDLEMYRGALSLLGKGYLTATGALGGYIFGLNLPRQS